MTFARSTFLRTIKNAFFSRSLGRFRGREAHRRVRTRDALHPSDSRGGQRRFEPSRVFPDRRSGGEKKKMRDEKACTLAGGSKNPSVASSDLLLFDGRDQNLSRSGEAGARRAPTRGSG
jgi:uncharacterized protein with WD repeat